MARLTESLILRRAAIYANPGEPSARLPIVYGDFAEGEQGVLPAVEIQMWDGVSQVFLWADHETLEQAEGAERIYADDQLVVGGYTISYFTDFEGQGLVSIVTFDSDHTGQQISLKGVFGKRRGTYSDEPGSPAFLSAMSGSSGLLIENPAEIIYDLAVRVHGVQNDEWDPSAFGAAFGACVSGGYAAAGVILDDGQIVNLAAEILKPIGGAEVSSTGALQLYVETVPDGPTPEEIFEESELDSFAAERRLEDVVNQIHLDYRYNFRKQVYQSLARLFDAEVQELDAQSQVEFGLHAQSLEAPWVRDDGVATAIAATLITLSRRPRWRFTLGFRGFRAMLQQPSDVVAFSSRKIPGGSASGAPGYQRLMRVQRTTIDPGRGGVTLAGVDLEQNA